MGVLGRRKEIALDEVLEEIDRFRKFAEVAKTKKGERLYQSRETAQLTRASMDLSQSLVRFRATSNY